MYQVTNPLSRKYNRHYHLRHLNDIREFHKFTVFRLIMVIRLRGCIKIEFQREGNKGSTLD